MEVADGTPGIDAGLSTRTLSREIERRADTLTRWRAPGAPLLAFGLAGAVVGVVGWEGGQLAVAVVALAVGGGLVLAGRRSGTASANRLGSTPATPEAVIDQEMQRSRRHERPFTLARFRRVGEDPASAAELLRENDCLWVLGDDVLVLLPETDRLGAAVALGRLRGEMRTSHHLSTASFPEDALTVPGLVEALAEPGVEPVTSDGEHRVEQVDHADLPPSPPTLRAEPARETR